MAGFVTSLFGQGNGCQFILESPHQERYFNKSRRVQALQNPEGKRKRKEERGLYCDEGVSRAWKYAHMGEPASFFRQDDKKSAGWQHLSRWQHLLGCLYHRGFGVHQNNQKAVKWYRLAVIQGYADAQFNLGCMYFLGQGIEQDEREGARLCRLAAEQGNMDAQNNLGFMLEKGRGIVQDKQEAMKWYRLASEQGHIIAQKKINSLESA